MPDGDELSGLMQAVARGDRQAFAVLHKCLAPQVKAYLMRLGCNESRCDDLVQETFITLWRKAALFDTRRAGVATWAFTIARNLRVDQLRRTGLVGLFDGEDDDTQLADTAPLPEDQAYAHQRETQLREAMSQLSPEQAMILRLSFFEDQPHMRIAQDLGIPLGTVKSRVRLAASRLRRLLGDPDTP